MYKKYFRPIALLILLSALLSSLVGCTSAQPSSPPDYEQRGSVTVTPGSELDTEIEAGNVLIETEPEKAEIRVNGKLQGTASLTLELSPGSYRITASRSGYSAFSLWVDLGPDEEKKIEFELEALTGIFAPHVSPKDAEILLGENRIANTPVRLPTGTYELLVRRFGYRSVRTQVKIEENSRYEQTIDLEKAPADLSRLSVSRKTINPQVGGIYRSSQISFRISAPAELICTVYRPNGAILGRTATDIAVQTSFHSFRWPGEEGKATREKTSPGEDRPEKTIAQATPFPKLSEDGAFIPPELPFAAEPKQYRIEVQADFIEGPVLSESVSILVDPALSSHPFPSPRGGSGTFLTGTPPQEVEHLHIGFLPFFYSDPEAEADKQEMYFPTSLFVEKSLSGGHSFSLNAGVEIAEEGKDAVFSSVEAKTLLFEQHLPPSIRSSVSLEGGYRRFHRYGSFAPETGVELSFPVRLGFPRIGLVLEPRGGVIYTTGKNRIDVNEKDSYETAAMAGAGGALTFAGEFLSGALSAGIDYGTPSSNPARVQAAAELHLLIPNSNFLVGLYGAADLSEGLSEAITGGGIGSSLIY